MRKLVSFDVLEAVLAPICDPQEPVYSLLSNVDGCNADQLKVVLRKYIKPYYDTFDERSKQVIDAGIVYLSASAIPQKDHALSALPTPFDLPNDVKNFCLLLSQELGINPMGGEVNSCEYSDDLNLVHRLRRNRNSFRT